MDGTRPRIGEVFSCVNCGQDVVRTNFKQKYCRACAYQSRHRKTGRGTGARLNRRFLDTAKPRTLAGLSIVEVDRLAKEQHTSYGKLVAGWAEEKQKAAGDAAPTT